VLHDSSPSQLFPELLGGQFDDLAQAVRAVHDAGSIELKGTATVRRGESLGARLLCRLLHLPQEQIDGQVYVSIWAQNGREHWVRYFGVSPPMRSTLSRRGERLVEKLGPVRLHFNPYASHGTLVWKVARATFLGVPLPRRLIRNVKARAAEQQGRYRFDIAVSVAGVGPVISYRGTLETVRDISHAVARESHLEVVGD
jgi:hypothetical protein